MKKTVLSVIFCINFIIAIPLQLSASADVAELVYTDEELAEVSKWEHKSMSDMVRDAFRGDRGALYSLGMCNLMGVQGFVIDIEKANKFFSMSASLGFAPALNKLKSMYIEDKQDPLLAMVYLNLAASYGHPELIVPYHTIRSKLLAALGSRGPSVVAELERIAEEKRQFIENNLKELKKPENQNYAGKYNRVILFNKITAQDSEYNSEYWARISSRKDG